MGLSDEERKKRHRVYQKRYISKPGMKEKRAKWNKDWRQKNKERYNLAKREYRFKLKMEVISQYTEGKMNCSICGYDKDLDALCIDHINDDGSQHRKQLGCSARNSVSGTTIYERIKALGFMEGLQVLCFNCNTIKELRRKRDGLTSQQMIETVKNPIRWINEHNITE